MGGGGALAYARGGGQGGAATNLGGWVVNVERRPQELDTELREARGDERADAHARFRHFPKKLRRGGAGSPATASQKTQAPRPEGSPAAACAPCPACGAGEEAGGEGGTWSRCRPPPTFGPLQCYHRPRPHPSRCRCRRQMPAAPLTGRAAALESQRQPTRVAPERRGAAERRPPARTPRRARGAVGGRSTPRRSRRRPRARRRCLSQSQLPVRMTGWPLQPRD